MTTRAQCEANCKASQSSTGQEWKARLSVVSRVDGAVVNWAARKGGFADDGWAVQRETAWDSSLAGWLVDGWGWWMVVWMAP